MSSEPFPLSADAVAIRSSIHQRQLREVYHYTPIAQVPGIVQYCGIHPRAVLRERGIQFNDDSTRWSNRLEKAEALAGYVAVSIVRPWGMMQHDLDCVVFGIKASILLRVGTAFMGDWSSRGEIRDLRDVEDREGAARFDDMFDNSTSSWPSPIPGEVLVRGSINESEVAHLYVRSKQHLERVRQILRENNVRKHPPYGARIADRIFPPSMREEDVR